METIGQYLLSQKRKYVVKQKFDINLYYSNIGMKHLDSNKTISKIKKQLEAIYGTNFEQINTKCRKREITDLRAVFCYFARHYTTLSFKDIGAHFTAFEHYEYRKVKSEKLTNKGTYSKKFNIGIGHADVIYHCENYERIYQQNRMLKKNHELMINELTNEH